MPRDYFRHIINCCATHRLPTEPHGPVGLTVLFPPEIKWPRLEFNSSPHTSQSCKQLINSLKTNNFQVLVYPTLYETFPHFACLSFCSAPHVDEDEGGALVADRGNWSAALHTTNLTCTGAGSNPSHYSVRTACTIDTQPLLQEPVNAVQGNSRCLFSYPHKTHKYSLCGHNVEFLNVKLCGTKCDHWA